jgi:branched-chain amino acid transport system substrate-binding protein
MVWTRMRCRPAAIAALTGTVALLAAACGSSGSSGGSASSSGSASSHSPIIVGNEADLTGNATVGVPGSYGVKFAVAQINSHGGVDGHKLKLVTEDSQGSSVGGIAAVRRLIEVDHAQAIVNTASSDSTIPTLPTTQSAQVPFIVSAASDPVIVSPSNTYVFMSPSVPVNLDVKEYVKYIKAKGYKSIALIATNAAFASAAVALFKTEAPAAGIKLATIQSFAATDTDFSSQVHAAQASHADAVFVIGDFLGAVLKQARNVGLNVPFMYDASTTDPLLIQSLGKESNGLVSFQTQATQLLDATTQPMTTWESQFKAAFPSAPAGVPSQFSLEGYEATYVLAEGIKLALQHGALTGSSIKAGLEKISGFVAGKTDFSYAVPIGYPVTFSASNHAGDSTVTPVVVKNGIWVPQG